MGLTYRVSLAFKHVSKTSIKFMTNTKPLYCPGKVGQAKEPPYKGPSKTHKIPIEYQEKVASGPNLALSRIIFLIIICAGYLPPNCFFVKHMAPNFM